MKIYRFPELLKSHPRIIQRALKAGTLQPGNVHIELPDDFDFGENQPVEAMRGLGDLVAKFAKPIAVAIDAVAGTNFKNCGGCAQRQEDLNEAVPF